MTLVTVATGLETLTVHVAVTTFPSMVALAVIVALPALFAVILPELLTDATVELLDEKLTVAPLLAVAVRL